MEFLKTILEIATYLQWIAVAMFILGGIGLALHGLQKSNSRIVVLGMAIGFSPFLVPAAINTVQKLQRQARRAAVAAMPREALPADYPRQLLFRGDIDRQDVARLMVLTDLDQIMVENSSGRLWYSGADHSERCRSAVGVARHRDSSSVSPASRPRGKLFYPAQWEADRREINAQIEQLKATNKIRVACGPHDFRPFGFSSTYLVARADQAVTRRAQDRRAAPEAIQIDLVKGGRVHLIHYDEMPVTDAQFSTFMLPLIHPKFSCAGGFDDAQVIINVLDVARDRARVDAIIRREGRNDLCVVSEAPTS